MSGNIYQWCENLYTSGKTVRVVRGGSWFSGSRFCRGAFRNDFEPGYRFFHVGVRLCFRLD